MAASASSLICRASAVLALTVLVSAAQGRTQVTVYVNGKVFTAADNNRLASAFAVRGESFIAVGGGAAVAPYLRRGAKRVDLHGAFVVPGLGDDHFHGEGGGPGLDLSKVRSLSQLLAKVAQAARVKSSGGMVVSNPDWHEAQLMEQRLPTAEELDLAAPNVPVILARGGHSLILNSAALAKYGITATSVQPPGGVIARDEHGRLTGRIDDTARALVALPPAPPLGAADFVATQRAMNAFGVTSVRIPGFYKSSATGVYPLARQLADAHRLTLRYTIYLPGPGFAGAGDYYQHAGLRQDEGDEWARVGGLKLGVDGGFEGGHMTEPYTEPFGHGGTYSGIEVIPPTRFDAEVEMLARQGWRIATHAVGDAAIEQVLDAYEKASHIAPVAGRRWTIEHAFLIRPDQIVRARRLGLMMSVQDHLYLAGPSLRRMWGAKRADYITPLPALLASGMVIAGGTDAPVVPPNPFWAMYHFLSRDTIAGGVMGADQRVTDRSAVLKMFTINYAKLIGAEAVRGSIEPGKFADFVVLSADYLTIPIGGIRDLRALRTYVGGRQVYPAQIPAD